MRIPFKMLHLKNNSHSMFSVREVCYYLIFRGLLVLNVDSVL